MINPWLAIARDDLDAAQGLYNTARYLYAASMCQQAAEKSLKALIQNRTAELPPRVHSLERLAELAGVYDEVQTMFPDFLSRLEPYYIQARIESK